MADGLSAALHRAFTAIMPKSSRFAPYRCRYWLAFTPIQFAAEAAPNGNDHCWGPGTRPPPPCSRSAAYVDSHTVRKHRTCRQRPAATAIIAAMIAPPWPGRSMPPLIHVGCMRKASSTAAMPPSLIPMPTGPGYVERPSISDSSKPASATAARHASIVSDNGSTISRRPVADRPMPDITDRCSNRSVVTG